jgi:hypothetical protein
MITVQSAKTLDEGVKNLINASNEDYKRTNSNQSMIEEFENGWSVSNGRKFIKVCKAKYGVHSFIVKEDFKHFKKGDVLKPASWNAPALNQARGNVLKGNYPIQWTGPLYLK